MTTFVKLPVVNPNQEIYFNPNLIKTIQSSLDKKTTYISIGREQSFQIGLPIVEVFKLINNF